MAFMAEDQTFSLSVIVVTNIQVFPPTGHLFSQMPQPTHNGSRR
jgi:hypothetical protein